MPLKKLKVSVGIPAHNEEANIRNLLLDLIGQKQKDFEIMEIIVVLDGCTDKTDKEVMKVKNEKIYLFNDKIRKGKASRLNEIFQKSQGELLILLDADVRIDSNDVLSSLILPYLEDRTIGLICGNAIPFEGQTFVERAVNSSVKAYDNFRMEIKNGDNIFSCSGPIVAISKSFYASLILPPEILADDAYLYFAAKIKGYSFKYSDKAIVWYRSPSTITDQINQNKRFEVARNQLQSYFGELAKKEYQVPKRLFYKHLMWQFIQDPLPSFSILVINLYCRWLAKKQSNGLNSLWSISKTTKGGLKLHGAKA